VILKIFIFNVKLKLFF